jgi:hypothetical protein
MGTQLLAGVTVSVVNFAIHAVITALIVLATRHIARVTSEMGMFARLPSLLTITVLALICAHIVDFTFFEAPLEYLRAIMLLHTTISRPLFGDGVNYAVFLKCDFRSKARHPPWSLQQT